MATAPNVAAIVGHLAVPARYPVDDASCRHDAYTTRTRCRHDADTTRNQDMRTDIVLNLTRLPCPYRGYGLWGQVRRPVGIIS